MLQTRGVKFSYDTDNRFSFPDITCRTGEHWLLLGSSGSGKTTMLHLLGGLLKPTRGSIHLGGQDITLLQGSQLDKFRGKNIGIIFQQSHFVRSLTVEENLRLARQLAGLKPDAEKIKHVLKRLNIQDKAHAKPHRLSVGEQQRANICRALVNDPQLILADEPTSALDDHNCTEVVNLLTQQAEADQITLLIVTHDNRLKRIFQNQINLNTKGAHELI